MSKITRGLNPQVGRRHLEAMHSFHPEMKNRACKPLPSLLGRQRQRGRVFIKATLMLVILGGALGFAVGTLQAELVTPPDPVAAFVSLKSIPVPGPSPEVLAQFVVDKTAAVQLGKALFWDTKVGSDNKTACASCHFHAGADNRITNQLSPGLLAGDKTFQLGGPNYTLKPADFPFTKHLFVDQARPQLSDVNEVVGSQGVFTATFNEVNRTGGADYCANVPDDVFHGGSGFNINGVNTRQVTGRNTPTVINAVFNFRNFWDGRANNIFNGGDPFGMRNPNALVWKMEAGVMRQTKVAIPSSALASQIVGPPLSGVEMSCRGRTFVRVGKKLLGHVPLSAQAIARDDSVLAPLAELRAKNASPTYTELIKQAFRPEYWASPVAINYPLSSPASVGSMDKRYPRPIINDWARFQASQMEANFSLFFGLAVQMYLSTLVADDTPFDRHAEGKTNALTPQQMRGLAIFQGDGAKCINCHSGAELTGASFSNVSRVRLERMPMGNNQEAIYDDGFYNIGVRPTTDDLGVGGTDPFGNPLSETRMVQSGKAHLLGNGFDPVREPSVSPSQRVAVEGAFKVPGLRNVEFTGPYFHNGGKATLMQVVDFYNRGGDFADVNKMNLAPDILPIGLTENEKQDLVAFLLALSDDRVRYQKAPFDHPSICVNHGHQVNASGALRQDGTTGKAIDNMQCLPAVGAGGLSTGLKPFLNLSPFQH